MNKNIYIIAFIIALFPFFCSCGDDGKDDFMDEYDSILAILKSGEQDVAMYNTGEPTTYSLSISKGGSSTAAVASAKIELMSQADLDLYNSDNGTSYKILPQDSYKFLTDLDLKFKSEDMYTVVDIQFESSKISSLQGEYILPINLISETKINAEKDFVFLKPILTDVVVGFEKVEDNEIGLIDDVVTKDIPVILSIKNDWDFYSKIAVDESLVDEYNNKNGTDYKILPVGAYTLKNGGKVDFKSGSNKEPVTIVIERAKFEEGIFLLPLTVTECSKEEFVTGSPVYFLVNNERMQKIELKESMLSTNALEPKEGSLANLLDNNTATYFHTAWSVTISESHYLQVEFDEPVTEFSFNFVGRSSNGNGNPAEIIITGSNDGGKNFFDIKTIEDQDLPTGAMARYESDPIVSEKAKIIRFTVPKNKTGGVFFVFSEFGIRKALY